MTNTLKRRSVLVASAAALVGVSVEESQAKTSKAKDPYLDSVLERLLDQKERGATLSPVQKYCALLSCVTAQALPEAAEKIVLRALKEKDIAARNQRNRFISALLMWESGVSRKPWKASTMHLKKLTFHCLCRRQRP